MIQLIGYIVVGGFLACLGVVSTKPSVTGKQMIAWAGFILFVAPILLLLFAALLGINL